MIKKPSIIIIGGGLAGLTNAILLSRAGFEVSLIERKTYPFHKVCGEYISNEVLPFLINIIGLNPEDFNASKIKHLIISSPKGKVMQAPLDLGGFGLSRFILDHELYKIALAEGVNFILGEKVNNVVFENNEFTISLNSQELKADLVIGAYGKRSNLDQKLNRKFFYQRSPYVGVKYHVKLDFPDNTIQLDNFTGGYCGLNKIEDDLYCLCYLSENESLKKYGSIKALEEEVLMKNPQLRDIYKNSTFLWDKPETINEISFERKALIENHILMCGDTAGMIAPLCGNGMAIGIHAAKILSDSIISICSNGIDNNIRNELEYQYQREWNKQFAFRLKTGRAIQRLFGRDAIANAAISLLNNFPSVLNTMIKNTHGKPF